MITLVFSSNASGLLLHEMKESESYRLYLFSKRIDLVAERDFGPRPEGSHPSGKAGRAALSICYCNV